MRYQRTDIADPLSHPRRREIYNAVNEKPGLNGNQLRKYLGIGNGNFWHHIQLLVESGLVVRREPEKRRTATLHELSFFTRAYLEAEAAMDGLFGESHSYPVSIARV